MVNGQYEVMVFFFFKQKTAYELRISDWSSDVCSSDLTPGTWTRARSRRLRAGEGSLSEVTNIATSEPGFTKPATRAGSVRLTEIAIIPSGIASEVFSTVPPKRLAVTCSPWKIRVVATRPLRAVRSVWAPSDRKSTRLNSSH